MPSAEFIQWLKAKRRKTWALSSLYSLLAFVGGGILIAPVLFLTYLAAKVFVLSVAPTTPSPTIWSCIVAALVMGLLFADSIRAAREDMSILPKWLMQEFLHAGPRLITEGGRQAARAAGWVRLDIPSCANVLHYLTARKNSASRQELAEVFPEINWPRLLKHLRLLEGVLFLRADVSRLALTSTLRLELSSLVIEESQSEEFEAEEARVPVEEPERLTANEILGVAADASLAEIKIAYRHRIKDCHPDRFAGADEKALMLAEEWTKSLNAAYETLVAEKRRGRREV